MRNAVCQMRSGEDVEANVALAERLLHEAAEGDADIASLPETFTYLGRSEGRVAAAEPVPGPTTDRLSAIARECSMWIVGGSLLERGDDGRIYNTCPLLDRDGELVARYRKIHLYDVELPGQPPFRESATFAPGDQLITHETDGARIGLSICDDLRFPELYRGLVVMGAEVLFVPAQFQQQTGKDHWEVLLKARAIEDQCYVVAAAQWGTFGAPEKGRRSFGHSMVVDPWGRVVVSGPEEGDGVWFADLDMSELRRIRQTLPALQHRRLGLTC